MNERNHPNTSDSAEQPHLQSLATQGVEAIRGGGGGRAPLADSCVMMLKF